MNDTCRVHMDGEILDIGSRYAIYGTALLTLGLGCLAMVNVSRDIAATPVGTPGTTRSADDETYTNIRSHKKTIRPVSTTLNLMGVAMVGAAFIYQSNTIQEQAAAKIEQNPSMNPQGPFTLFHAYTLLSLLWLITLVGMMIHVQTWVFNVIRRRSVIGHDKRRFINSIWNGTHWYLLQVETLGVYGLYVSTNRDKFPPPPCNIPIFNNAGFRMFARVVYIIALIPIINVMLLCMLLVGTVWAMSWVATRLKNHDEQEKSVSPMVFNFFWLLVCGIIILAIGITTEILLFVNTDSQNVWSFGSLLALILLVVPAETFVGELYSMMVPENVRIDFKTRLGTHRRRYESVPNGQDETLFQYKPFRLSMPEPEVHR
ncbi:unnamed protein product [Rhizoctonia solani]|uniref:Transmembrane protein n=1 Tax=Rhizoctonia solani TaxID=456999 RepID=A0A8H3ASJ2_9AGAM|nr:unnamed protein product [Rhizoctonia solani]